MKLNLPNKLTVLRMILVPIFVVVMMVSDALWASITGLCLFVIASLTDMLDGKIARRNNLITDFGKFMDPLADKLLVFGAMIGLLVINRGDELFCKIFVWVAFIIIFRELAVTSMRMVVSNSEGIVIAANIWGKLKTLSQLIGIVIIILEPLVWDCYAVSYVFMGIMVFTTLFSGFNYFKAYWPYINSNK